MLLSSWKQVLGHLKEDMPLSPPYLSSQDIALSSGCISKRAKILVINV